MPDATGNLDPAEHLADLISRSPRQQSALAVQRELCREAGLVPSAAALEPPGQSLGLSR